MFFKEGNKILLTTELKIVAFRRVFDRTDTDLKNFTLYYLKKNLTKITRV